MSCTIHHGDCLDVLKTMEENSVHSIVTDPPYGLSFMGKAWDHSVPSAEVWAECLRVLKPGGHLLAFAGTRTQHRMAVNIEDAGFEIRDMIAWVYGSGFPKSLNVTLAIDKQSGAIGNRGKAFRTAGAGDRQDIQEKNGVVGMSYTTPATPEAQQWQGWGTALKPALEPVTVARKPFKGTVAANVLAHGTGAINVDGCRVGAVGEDYNHPGNLEKRPMAVNSFMASQRGDTKVTKSPPHTQGRWPANFIHDGSDEAVTLLGDPARFFYCAKASKKDRDEGVEGVAGVAGVGALRDNGRQSLPRKNNHPTVKPTDLMRYLLRLVTPPNGTVLDPFMGSGSTGKGATLEGFDFIGIELDADYIEIARARIDAVDPDNVLC